MAAQREQAGMSLAAGKCPKGGAAEPVVRSGHPGAEQPIGRVLSAKASVREIIDMATQALMVRVGEELCVSPLLNSVRTKLV